jgi:hypothetical protein
MKQLVSERLRLPKVYFISDRAEIKDIPIGVPFIFGDESVEPHLVRLLEYEVLYQEAIKSGYPFDFRQILKDAGFDDNTDFWYHHPCYMELTTEGVDLDKDPEADETLSHMGEKWGKYKEFIKDHAAYVDIEKLKKLKVFPIWLDKIEKAVHTNIHNFAVYNENMYNKKLEGMYGALDLVSPSRNLIIIDISGSIPKAVSSTCLTLAKNLAETFYADLLITGSKSTLYPYERLNDLNINTIYQENGMDNDQVYFRKLVTSDRRKYKTAIVFGDNHSPGWNWSNSYNRGCGTISKEDGQKLCEWEIEKLISFHTQKHARYKGERAVAGYAEWFTPKEIEHVDDWVKYLK